MDVAKSPRLVKRRALLAAMAGGAFIAPDRVRAEPSAPFDERFRDLIKAARAEGEVTWYQGSLEAAGRDFSVMFQKRFGVKVNHVFGIGSPAFERFRAEARAGKTVGDVFNATDAILMYQLMKEGLIADYRTASVDDFPDGWTMRVGGGIAYPTSRTQMVFMWNTQSVTPEKAKLLRQWKGLLDPSFGDGRMGLGDATRSGGVYAAYHYLLRANPQQYGLPFLRGIAAQKPVLFAAHTEMGAQIASGALDVGVTFDPVSLQQYELGAPIGFAFPDPTPAVLLMTGVAKTAPHPSAARLLMEYTTSAEGMVEWGKLYRAGLGRPALDAKIVQRVVREPWFAPPPTNYVITDAEAAARDHDAVIKEWSSVFKP